MKLLLHTCCGPCLTAPAHALLSEGITFTPYFFNPNIMPYREFRARLKSFMDLGRAMSLDVLADEQYSLEPALRALLDTNGFPRCLACYRLRLDQTASLAAQKGFDAFSTTLSVSPFQSHDLIQKAGQESAMHFGVPFHYVDWRPVFQQGHARAVELGLYMQTWCGCVFSEEERYRSGARKKAARLRKLQPGGTA
ncbi:MAG TPA: epoxyqueuosine reductase QueH [Candidatus Sumerlaeota bacterium]|nr:epoxyqueuosine reductase QueH [Candidatus Sumerlaeota bacterium]